MQSGGLLRGQLFIHWLIANAAGLGTLWGVFELVPLGMFQSGISDTFIPLAIVTLGIIGLLSILRLQQRILQAAGLQSPFWMAASLFGLIFGLVSGLLAGNVALHALRHYSFYTLNLPAVLALFTGGLVFGAVQSIGFARRLRYQFVWTSVNGLVVFALVLCIEFFNTRERAYCAAFVFTLVGGLYGLVTGGCLVWLLPATGGEMHRNST